MRKKYWTREEWLKAKRKQNKRYRLTEQGKATAKRGQTNYYKKNAEVIKAKKKQAYIPKPKSEEEQVSPEIAKRKEYCKAYYRKNKVKIKMNKLRRLERALFSH